MSSDDARGASGEPRNLIEHVVDAAMRAVEAALAEHGATVDTLYIALHADGMPDGELDAVSAATGPGLSEDMPERAVDVVTFLVTEAALAGRQVGLAVHVVPMPEPGRG